MTIIPFRPRPGFGAYDPHPLNPNPPEADNPDDAAGGVIKGVGLGVLIYVAVGVLWFAGRAVLSIVGV